MSMTKGAAGAIALLALLSASPTFSQEFATLAQAVENTQPNANIVGYVEFSGIVDGQHIISGWAANTKDFATPVSVSAFADDTAMGGAMPSAANSAVSQHIGAPEDLLTQFSIVAPWACPSGAALTVLATTPDGGMAGLGYASEVEPVCP